MDKKKKTEFLHQHKEVLKEIFNDRREALKENIFLQADNLTEEELRLRIKMVNELTSWRNIMESLNQKSKSKENYR